MEVKRVLEHIGGKTDKSTRHPEAIQRQQPDANHQGCKYNVRELKISGSHNARYWNFVSISESPK